MKNNFDVCIVGAGVVGASIARELSRYRIRTALLEKEVDVSFGTSKANSGIIHAGFHAPPKTLKAELSVKGNRAFDRLSEELEFPFERRGELVVAFDEEELRMLQSLYRTGRENHVQYLEILGRERTLELDKLNSPAIVLFEDEIVNCAECGSPIASRAMLNSIKAKVPSTGQFTSSQIELCPMCKIKGWR